MSIVPGLEQVRQRHRLSPRLWSVSAAIITAAAFLPVTSLLLIALQGNDGLWSHLLLHVLPAALSETLILLIGVGIIVSLVGTITAWLVTAYDFPGRKIFEWALLLPLAVPTYIVAYAYLDILHPVGAVQTAARSLLGYTTAHDFRLPEVRSMGGCILLLSFVLYPYVYLTTRALFLMQAESLIEASRTLGISRGGVFRHVALPLARPAIAVGVSLALMEALNDIGASEFLGIQTLTVSIYSTWINRSDLPGAAQISIAALALVVTLIVLERRARRHQRYTVAAQRPRTMQPLKLSGLKAIGVFAVCAIPITLGFLAPACYLVIEAAKRYRFAAVSARLVQETINTLTVSALATVVVLLCGLTVVYAARLYPGKSSAFLTRTSSLGYALPGTVLAIGILFPAGIADNFIAGIWQKFFGISTGLVLLGSGAALIYAYAARFMAISTGGIEAGFHRIPPSLDFAARTLGETPAGVLRRIHLPLSKPAIAAAGLLVFVDCMKELPATLLLRPLNFETLATHLYGEAARGTYEEASIAALLIVFVGILPVALLARMGNRWAR